MTDPRIEVVARAMCVANMNDPDRIDPQSSLPRWAGFIIPATLHIAAYDTLRKMEKENGDG